MEECEVCTEPKLKVIGTTVIWGKLGLRRHPNQLIESEQKGCRNCKLMRSVLLRTSPEWERDHDEEGNFKCYYVIDSSYGASKGAEITVRTKEKILRTIMLFSPDDINWSIVQRGTKISGDTSSDECLDHIKSWTHQCQTEHKLCRMENFAPIPKRVLDLLCGDAEIVKLYESRGERIPYACLSHCWGKKQLITTTRSNLINHKEGIAMSALPPTFRDAITVTRRLGLRYLWIDSLCILQDPNDKIDWTEQAPLMGNIYASAFLTIAATSSVDSSGGLFRKSSRSYVGEKIPGANEDIYIRFPLRHATHDTSSGPSGRAAHYVSLDNNPYTGYPLLSRAWAFQERIYTNRIVHFTTTEIVWECNTETRCECTVRSKKQTTKQRFLPVLQAMSTKVTDVSNEFLPEHIQAWRQMISAYSARYLTYETDRLHACSSFANQIQPLLGGRYLAGLWENLLLDDLCWHRMLGPALTPKSSTYVAPSWAWPSIGSEVFWAGGSESNKSFRLNETHLEIIDVQTTLATKDQFGAVTDGYLKVKGPLLDARYEHTTSAVILSKRHCLYVGNNLFEFTVDYSLETPGPNQVVHNEVVFLLSIGRIRDRLKVMVLRKCKQGNFERIGFAEPSIREFNNEDPEYPEYPKGRETMWKKLFETVERKEIKII